MTEKNGQSPQQHQPHPQSGRNARAIALRALGRWRQQRIFADSVLHEILADNIRRLEERDRALVAELFYGVLRNLGPLDFLIDRLRSEGALQEEARDVLRLGLYQLLFLRVPDHAAVNETVNISGRARKLVNAILRRTIREREELLEALKFAPEHVRLSHPEFLLERWRTRWDASTATALAEWNNLPAPVYVRINPLKEEIARAALDQAVEEGSAVKAEHSLFYKVDHLQAAWLEDGLIYVQDPSTALAVELLDPKPEETLLDAAAAPGGKATLAAALMKNTGRVAAVDSNANRIKPLMENVLRLGLENMQTFQLDWLKAKGPFHAKTFDGILLDAPCSNTGVMRRRVDVRWRLEPADFGEMPALQLALARTLVPLLKPGGRLIYSTCSLEREENEAVVEALVAEFPELQIDKMADRQPWRDGVDGAFAAKLLKVK